MTIILTVLFTLIAFYLHRQIRRNFIPITIVITIISILSLMIDLQVFTIITQGFIGFSLFVVVMFAGAFQKQTKISKRLRSVRKEYSIFGFIFLTPHFIQYLLMFIDGTYDWEWYGVIAAIIMVPLFITSFKMFKSKMDIKKWKKLQKLAYLVYLLIFLHLILVAEPQESLVYIIIFASYSFLKLKNYLYDYKFQPLGYITLIALAALTSIHSIKELTDV